MWQRLKKKLKLKAGNFRKSEKGMTAVEFALVAPPFILLLGTIIETGLMVFTEYAIQSAVQDSARMVRTGQAQGGAMDQNAFKTAICTTAKFVIDCSKLYVYVRSEANFATLKSNLPSFYSIGPSFVVGTPPPACYNPGQPAQPAAVVATYDWYFTMWGMSYLGNITNNDARRLVGFAIFRNEPFPAAATTPCP